MAIYKNCIKLGLRINYSQNVLCEVREKGTKLYQIKAYNDLHLSKGFSCTKL